MINLNNDGNLALPKEDTGPKSSAFDHVIKALTLGGSLTKEALLDLNELSFNPKDYYDIMVGKKEVTGYDFLKRLHLHEHPEDKDWKPNKVASFLFDVALDPITYASLGTGNIASKLVKRGLSAKKAAVVAKTALGAGLGLASSDYKDSGVDVLKNMAIGAVGANVAGPILRKTASKVGEKLSGGIAKYYEKSRAKAFETVGGIADKNKAPKTYMGADKLIKTKDTYRRIDKYFRDALAGKQEVFDEFLKTTKLPEAKARKLYGETISKAGGEIVSARKKALQEIIDKEIEATDFTGLKKSEKLKLKKEIEEKVFAENSNRLLTEANTVVGRKTLKYIDSLGDEALSKAIRGFRENNRKMMEVYNKVHGTKQVPIDFHTADTLGDVLPFEKQLGRDVTEGFVKRNKESFDISDVPIEEIDYIASKRYSKSFMTKQEKIANRILRIPKEIKPTIEGMPSLTKNLQRFETGLKHYDTFINDYIKPSHLFFTHTWLMNNYLDNNLKTLIEHGEHAAFKTAKESLPFNNLLKRKGNNTYKEMLEMFNPKNGHLKVKFRNDMLDAASRLGVVDSNFYTAMMDSSKDNIASIIAQKGKREGEKYIKELAERNLLHKGADKFIFMLKDKVGTHGAAVEGVARLKAWEHQMKLLSSPRLEKLIKEKGWSKLLDDKEFIQTAEKAKKYVNDIFFDYSNVNLFEQKVMKRIAPYYTFFSRNLDYHLDALFRKTSAMSKIVKISQNLGRKPTEDERKGMPEWLLKYNPRVTNSDELKGLSVNYMPNISLIDALEVMSTPIDASRQRLSPIVKTIIEQVANKDMFLDKSLGVEDYWKNEKPVFQGGLLMKDLGFNIDERENGSLYTKDSGTARALNLKSNLMPTPLIDTLYGISHDISTGKRSTLDAIANKGFIKNRVLSPKSMAWHKRKRK